MPWHRFGSEDPYGSWVTPPGGDGGTALSRTPTNANGPRAMLGDRVLRVGSMRHVNIGWRLEPATGTAGR